MTDDEVEKTKQRIREEADEYERMTKGDVKHYKLTFVFSSGKTVERIVNEADMNRVFSLPSESYIFTTPNVDPISFSRAQLDYIDCKDYWPKQEAYFAWDRIRSRHRYYEEERERRKQSEQRQQPQKRSWF